MFPPQPFFNLEALHPSFQAPYFHHDALDMSQAATQAASTTLPGDFGKAHSE
jgi:hypothetical protein